MMTIPILKEKAKQAMATVSSDGGNITFPAWFVKVASATFVFLILIGGAAITSWAQTGQNTKDIAEHKVRIEKLEDKATEPTILAERIKAMNDQLDATNKALGETNKRLDMIIDGKRGANNDR